MITSEILHIIEEYGFKKTFIKTMFTLNKYTLLLSEYPQNECEVFISSGKNFIPREYPTIKLLIDKLNQIKIETKNIYE